MPAKPKDPITLMQPENLAKSSSRYALPLPIALGATLLLAACGGGGGGGGSSGGSGGTGWSPGVFQPASSFAARCVNPRSGTDPATNQPYPDIQGTRTDENNFLRSYSNDTYLWYSEIVDRDPSLFPTPEYFDLLVTNEVTQSGTPKDKFHFTFATDEYYALSQSGVSAGYGVQWVLLSASVPRDVRVAYTDPNTPATDAGLQRGAEVLEVDGVDVVSGTNTDALNAGLFPDGLNETHDFLIRDPDGTERTISMTSQSITSAPVQYVNTISTPTGNVGYMFFNDHIRTAEQQLMNAVSQLAADNITDLIVDMRYNGGGFLYIASELSYMIAGANQTGGRVFETLTFNDKYPSTNPVTGQPLSPTPFYNTATTGQSLPSLDLPRVFVLTGPGTCSASESVMNGLRGIDVEVIQIGSTTCGKPYGFYPTDNCGTTYFTIQFRGENALGFGDYSDGFSPQNAALQTTPLPGCQVADDFSHALGDPLEARLAAALAYRDSGSCPAPTSMSVPGVSKATAAGYREEDIVIPRSPLREMRILDRP